MNAPAPGRLLNWLRFGIRVSNSLPTENYDLYQFIMFFNGHKLVRPSKEFRVVPVSSDTPCSIIRMRGSGMTNSTNESTGISSTVRIDVLEYARQPDGWLLAGQCWPLPHGRREDRDGGESGVVLLVTHLLSDSLSVTVDKPLSPEESVLLKNCPDLIGTFLLYPILGWFLNYKPGWLSDCLSPAIRPYPISAISWNIVVSHHLLYKCV